MLHIHFQYQLLDPNVSSQTVAADHTMIVEAIRDRDAERAEQTAHAHATQFRGRFMQFLESSISSHMRLEATMPPAANA
jgi:DNA-binding GntR family transcriptional regulator